MTDSSADKPPADSKPRTWWIAEADGYAFQHKPECDDAYTFHVVEYSAFEQMRRERDELKAELTLIKLGQEFEAIANTKSIFRGEKIVQLLAKAEDQRDKLKAALEIVEDCNSKACNCKDVASKALHSQELPEFKVAGNPAESHCGTSEED